MSDLSPLFNCASSAATTASRSLRSLSASSSLRQTTWRLPSTFTCLTKGCVSPAWRSTRSGTKGSPLSSTILRTTASERSRAPRMYSSLRSSSPAMVAAEIMPRSATTQTRPIEKRCRKRSMTGSSVVTSAVLPGHIPGSKPGDRRAFAVDDETEDHLLQVGSIVLGIAVLAERLAALAVERQARRVHEHGGNVREQIAAAFEQPLLDHVLDAARRQRPGRPLLPFLAEPSHRPLEVMQA